MSALATSVVCVAHEYAPSTVPQIEHEVAHESNVAVLDIHGGA